MVLFAAAACGCGGDSHKGQRILARGPMCPRVTFERIGVETHVGWRFPVQRCEYGEENQATVAGIQPWNNVIHAVRLNAWHRNSIAYLLWFKGAEKQESHRIRPTHSFMHIHEVRRFGVDP